MHIGGAMHDRVQMHVDGANALDGANAHLHWGGWFSGMGVA